MADIPSTTNFETSTKGGKVRLRLKQLEDDRETWLDHWIEITNYELPSHGRYPSKGKEANEGDKKNQEIIDGTATRAIRVLAAGMQGGLTSPARPWFRLRLSDTNLTQLGPVRTWLDDVERIMYSLFSVSNFYSSIHGIYTELVGFGTACLYIEEDFEKFLRFRVMTAGEYSFALSAQGRVDTVYRRFWMQARQIVIKFGEDKVSDQLKLAADKTPYKFFEVVHAVQPRKERDMSKADSTNMAWESIYIEYDHPDKTLEESGYEEFPFMGPRWDVVGPDVYGRSVGMDALPDVKMLQEMQKSSLRAIHLGVRPPMTVPANYNRKLKMFPDAVNKIDPNQTEAVGKLFDFQFEVGATELKIDSVRNSIKETLYNDLWRLIADSGAGSEKMTATEVLEKKEEKLILLGPVVERQIHELLDPIIDRVFGIGMRNGWFPSPPPEIQEQDIDVEYVSLFARAQKVVETNAIDSTINFIGQIAELYPSAPDKIDIDVAIDERANSIGTPAKIIRTVDEVAKIREAKAQIAAEQQAQEDIAQGAEIAKTLSDTQIKDNALSEIIESVGSA